MSETALREAWERELRARVAYLLRSLADGDDAPPALRFKAEGVAEAGLALGLASAGELATLLDAIYREGCGTTIGERFPYPAESCIDAARTRVTLPFAMRRAPVYPAGTAQES
jgi:hypothetical protein